MPINWLPDLEDQRPEFKQLDESKFVDNAPGLPWDTAKQRALDEARRQMLVAIHAENRRMIENGSGAVEPAFVSRSVDGSGDASDNAIW